MAEDKIQGQKRRLREDMLHRRDSLSPEECAWASTGLRLQLLDLLTRLGWRGRRLSLGVYAAIRSELDLAPIWLDLKAWPADLYFPAVNGRGDSARLIFGCLPPDLMPAEFLSPGNFGVPEPPLSARLEALPVFDAVLMPGLAFDREGNRLGWGRAFYDRMLAALPEQPVLVGIGYAFQILPERLPTVAHDRKVDWLVTPQTCIKTGHP